jgi:hypothetical protein
MIRLTQTFGAHAGRVRELDQDVIRCGRLPTNDLAFDPHADLDASGNHAEIRREGTQWVLVDSGSRNGTLVNGRPVQRHVLADNEEIEFGTGGPRVRIQIEPSVLAAPAAFRAPQPTAPATPIDIAPPLSTPGSAGVPTPMWNAHSPVPLGASVRTPVPHQGALGDGKLYGQRTLDVAVETAEARARSGLPAPQVDRAELERIAANAANQQTRSLTIALGVAVVLLLGAVCLLGIVVAWLVAR